jgi:hypothetical protein
MFIWFTVTFQLFPDDEPESEANEPDNNSGSKLW